jgi:hypothetical protein
MKPKDAAAVFRLLADFLDSLPDADFTGVDASILVRCQTTEQLKFIQEKCPELSPAEIQVTTLTISNKNPDVRLVFSFPLNRIADLVTTTETVEKRAWKFRDGLQLEVDQ